MVAENHGKYCTEVDPKDVENILKTKPELDQIIKAYAHVPNLTLRINTDKTTKVW